MSTPATLQAGIYIDRGVPPLPAWRALFLDVEQGVTASATRQAVNQIIRMLTELRAGTLRDVGPDTAPTHSFDTLVGFGASFFDSVLHAPRLTDKDRPAGLVRLRRDGNAFPAIPWSTRPHIPSLCSGEADLLLQFTGKSDHAVSRAAVETAHVIRDARLPIRVVGTYDGFQRDDGRSWLGFHDGISNIEPSQRPAAVTCAGDPDWNTGGTYLAYLRLEISLDQWRQLSRTDQELIVGRDKATGWPIVSIDQTREPPLVEPLSREPLTDSTPWRIRNAYFNPPDTGCPAIEASHTHRTNQNKAAGTTPAGHRIYRQGYEYLEDITADGPRLGLNFISFQNDLLHLQQILGLRGWLGDANFGGANQLHTPAPTLTTLTAGGLYVVPPRSAPFPGADLLDGI